MEGSLVSIAGDGVAAPPAPARRSPSPPTAAAPSPHLLHVFPTFVPGGVEIRTVELIRRFGDELRHSVLALDGCASAAERLPSGRRPARIEPPPRAGSLATARGLRAIYRELRPDAVLTYNWGSFDALLAALASRRGRRLLARHTLHHEDGFNADEAARPKLRRALARRLVLPWARLVIVPSERLRRLAVSRWGVPSGRVRRIVNGVRAEAFQPADGNRRLRLELGIPSRAPLVGTVGALRAEKRYDRLLQALAAMPDAGAHLLLVGDGPERPRLEALAAQLGLAARVCFAGYQPDPAPFYRALDVYAISSDTEQLPVSLLEAMASALPVASTAVGDIGLALPSPQVDFLVPLGDGDAAALGAALTTLLRERELGRALGAANRERVGRDFSFDAMCAAYRESYAAVLRG